MSEVVMLAVQSLNTVSEKSLLDLSHMGVVSGILAQIEYDQITGQKILQAIGAKNAHELQRVCAAAGLDETACQQLIQLIRLAGPLTETLAKAKALALPEASRESLAELEALAQLLELHGVQNQINLDFSIINDMDYYNGVFFRGYVDGIPAAVLSGGRYDKLMEKMGRSCGAIGFAVYLDQLERFGRQPAAFDADALILYDDDSDLQLVIRTARSWHDMGKTVRVQRHRGQISCRQLIRIRGKEVAILETND